MYIYSAFCVHIYIYIYIYFSTLYVVDPWITCLRSLLRFLSTLWFIVTSNVQKCIYIYIYICAYLIEQIYAKVKTNKTYKLWAFTNCLFFAQ